MTVLGGIGLVVLGIVIGVVLLNALIVKAFMDHWR